MSTIPPPSWADVERAEAVARHERQRAEAAERERPMKTQTATLLAMDIWACKDDKSSERMVKIADDAIRVAERRGREQAIAVIIEANQELGGFCQREVDSVIRKIREIES